MQPRRRCIIVDPNQRLQQSHNYRYNRILYNNAKELGYDVVFLFNKSDKSDFSDTNCKIVNCFSHSTYDYMEIRSNIRNPRLANFGYLLHLVWQRIQSIQKPEFFTKFPDVSYVIGLIYRAFIVLISPLLYLINKIYVGQKFKKPPYLDDLFAREFSEQAQRLKINSNDTVIFHSANFSIIESLFLMRAHMNLSRPFDAAVHLIFHHSLTENHGKSFNLDYYQRSELRWLKRRCETGLPFTRMHLYGTNPDLVEQLSEESGIQFKLFNHIEERQKFGSLLDEALEARNTSSDRQIRIGLRAKDITVENGPALLSAFKTLGMKNKNLQFSVLGSRATSQSDCSRLIAEIPGCEVMATDSDDLYLSALMGLDLLVQPYRQEDYSRRISAVFVECALLGIATVSPADTTMHHSEDQAHVYAFAGLDGLKPAIEKFLKERTSAKFAERRLERIQQARKFYFRNAVSVDFESPSEPAVSINAFGPVAAVVSPFWGKCGSSTVFDSETEYLLQRGYFVVRLMVSQNRLTIAGLGPIFRFYEENSLRVKPHFFLLASRTRFRTLLLFMWPGFWRVSAFGQMIKMIGRSKDHDRRLAAYVYRHAEVAVVNHSFHGAYAKRFKKAKIILETQDIQANQIAGQNLRNFITQRRESVDAYLADEIKVWKQVDATVNLSQTENDHIARYCPNSFYIRPFIEGRQLTVQRSWSEFLRDNHLDQSFIDLDSADIMLWGDAHPLNVQSTIWFLNEVVLPDPELLQKNILIVGRLGETVHAHIGSRPRHYYSGFLDTLDDCFLHSKVLVLPDTSGTGMSIKSLEALALGRAFAATEIAMRGIQPGETHFHGTKSVEDLRKDIKSLLNSPAEQRARVKTARQLFALNFAPKAYYEKWDKVFDQVGVKKAGTP